MANNSPIDSLNFLNDIMQDMYGRNARENAALAKALQDSRTQLEATMAEDAAQEAEAPAKPAPVEPEVPKLPPFDQFWRTADESVDWTDALAYTESRDKLTDPELWSFYHEQAPKVLEGSLSAYVAVLKRSNPLTDLVPYAASFRVKAENADALSVTFETLPDYMKGSADDCRRYLAGISLRAARDLLALLPVCEARVRVMHEGETALDVTYTRQEVQKVRFTFVDPVAFCEQCGGVFSEIRIKTETVIEEAPTVEIETAEDADTGNKEAE